MISSKKNYHIICKHHFAHIPLGETESQGHTWPHGRLGNEVPTGQPHTLLKLREVLMLTQRSNYRFFEILCNGKANLKRKRISLQQVNMKTKELCLLSL